MNAPMNGHHQAPANFDNEISNALNASGVNEMTSTKTTGKLNMRISRIIVSKFSAKILGGLAVGAILMTATLFPAAANTVSANHPTTPLVSAAVPSDDQLIDDLVLQRRVILQGNSWADFEAGNERVRVSHDERSVAEEEDLSVFSHNASL